MSVLTDLVMQYVPHKENAASDALVRTLRRSPAARDGLVLLLDRLGVRNIGTPWVQREATGDNGERPDFSIRDENGRERAIIEAKFWAGLTDNQPLAYLDRLHGEDTALIFMCPPSRVESLWTEVRQHCLAGGVTFAESPTVAGRGASAGDSRIFVLSWLTILGAIKDEAERREDPAAVSDLAQIAELATRLDELDFVPLRATDLSPEFPRATMSWFSLVGDVLQTLTREEIAIQESNTGGTPTYYGATISLDGVWFWLGLWWPLWARTADTPFWLELRPQATEDWARAVAALDRLESAGRLVVREDDIAAVVVPLFPPLNREKQVVIQSLVDTVTAIRDALVLEREAATGPSPSNNIDQIEVGPAS